MLSKFRSIQTNPSKYRLLLVTFIVILHVIPQLRVGMFCGWRSPSIHFVSSSSLRFKFDPPFSSPLKCYSKIVLIDSKLLYSNGDHQVFDICWTVHHCDNKNKNQLDATYYFIVFLIGSTCFEQYYAHHQELATIILITTLVVSFLVCCRLEVR